MVWIINTKQNTVENWLSQLTKLQKGLEKFEDTCEYYNKEN